MIFEESIWIKDILKNLQKDADLSTLLNVGSSTHNFRTREQPHIYRNVFQPLEGKIQVDHLDLKKEEGVDIVGDLTQKVFLEEIKRRKYDLLICSNLLEHVSNPREICDCIQECIKVNGFLIITVPNLYPYHNDPIDTMFRPDLNELESMFTKSKIVKGDIIQIERNHFQSLIMNKKLMLLLLIRLITPFYKYSNWKKIILDIPNIFKNYKITCAVFERIS